MASRCAICERPITRAQRFVIAETEAMHTECAMRGGRTVVQRLQQELEAARSALASERRVSTDAAIAARRERRRADHAERDLDTHRRSLAHTSTLLQDAVADAAAARRDLAMHTALGGAAASSAPPRLTPPPSAPAEPTPPSKTPPPPEERDGTEVMMSLLEFK